MIETPQGDYYTPKEVLKIILKSEKYPLENDYTLRQLIFGGFVVSKEPAKK